MKVFFDVASSGDMYVEGDRHSPSHSFYLLKEVGISGALNIEAN